MKYLSDYMGSYVTLSVARMTEHGAYLISDDGVADDEVLLPKGELYSGTKVGDSLRVYIYKDSEDRLTATLKEGIISVGEVGAFDVSDVTDIGAFLSWGLLKDLFLPFKEQTRRVKPHDNVLVALYIDKSDRLCGTMNVYDYLSTDSSYKKGDHVNGRVYKIIDAFGAYIAVDDRYHGLVPISELVTDIRVGDIVTARVREVRDDKRLTLTLKEKTKVQLRTDADKIYERLTEAGGRLPFHDKTSPEIIKREFGMSKAAFKRAIGRLKKKNIIEIYEDGIVMK